MAKLLTPSGHINELSPKGGKFTRDELIFLLETETFEFIPLPNNLVMAVNKQIGENYIYPFNHLATLLLREAGLKGPFEFVVGNAVVMEAGEK